MKTKFLIFALWLVASRLAAQGCPGSLLFDGTNPAVNLPSSNQYYSGTNNGFTWECWFMLNTPVGSNIRPLICAVDGAPYEDQYLGFGWNSSPTYNYANSVLVFMVCGPSNIAPGPSCNWTPSGAGWHHAAGVMDYGSQTAKLYVDGVLRSTQSVTTAPITRIIPTSLSYDLGSPIPLYGNMAEPRIWNRPLTATEIATNYNQCLSGTEANLLVYYRCAQPGGTNVPDATPNANTGTFASSPGWSTLYPSAVTGTACSGNNVPIITSTGSTLTCAGTPIVLTASGSPFYYWSTGSSASSITVTPTAATTYTVWGNSPCTGATVAGVITISVIPVVNLSVSDVTLCTNVASGTNISVSGNYSPLSYTWSPGGAIGASIFVSPASTTIYTVTANLCPTTATLAVTVVTNCCSQPTAGLTTFGSGLSGSYGGTSYLLDHNISLSSSTNFNNAEVLMTPGVQINVPKSLVLNLNHVHMYACGIKMWQGIVVEDGGQVVSVNTKNSTLIEDAVTAIDVDNIGQAATPASPPIDLYQVIFNNNYTGIKLSNSLSSITSLPIEVSACVFSSRQLPFTSTTWPTANTASSGLRFGPSVAGSGLNPPYTLQGYSLATLKLPYPGQIANTGIKITNIGNQTGSMPSGTGVDLGFYYPSAQNDFNLFDGLSTGIDAEDASLSTVNNVFQNSYQGIYHHMNGLMNSLLELSPDNTTISSAIAAGISPSEFGNRFWDCTFGVSTNNVYQVDIQYGVFRSDHRFPQTGGPGDYGMQLLSDRFNYVIQKSEFENLNRSIYMTATSGSYDMGAGTTSGIYAGNITVNQNYFGAEISSSIPLGSEYSNRAVTLLGTGGNWSMNGNGSFLSNKLDRIYRGISVSYMDAYPTSISGNNMLLADDNGVELGLDQYAIYASNSTDYMVIDQNVASGTGTQNVHAKLIMSDNNSSISNGQSPIITCNQVSNAYTGFEFSRPNLSSYWFGNTMYQYMTVGLSLVQNCDIGTQGSSTFPCGDKWIDLVSGGNNWTTGGSVWETYADASSNNPSSSFLWCENTTAALPVTNGGPHPFAMGPSLGSTRSGADCNYPNTYPTVPTQRTMSPAKISESANGSASVNIFPNPTSGDVKIINSNGNETLNVTITDVTGKVVYSKNIAGNETLNLSSLKAAVYFIEVQDSNRNITRKKLIKTND